MKMRIRPWSCMDFVVLPVAIGFLAVGLDLLQAGFQEMGAAALANPIAWLLIVLAALELRWLFRLVPTWGAGNRLETGALTAIAKQTAMDAPGEWWGPDGALGNGAQLPNSAVCSYTRTLQQRAYGHLAVQVTAGVDRHGNVVGVDYHLEDVAFTAAELGLDWPSEEES